jgi:hypothetical protein
MAARVALDARKMTTSGLWINLKKSAWTIRLGQTMRGSQFAELHGSVIVNEPDLAIRAALDDVGPLYILRDYGAAMIADGRLVPLLETGCRRRPTASSCTIRAGGSIRPPCRR